MPWFDPWKRAVQHSLQQRDEVIPVQFAITENGCEQTRTDSLTCVDGHDRASAIGVTKEVVAALDSRNLEPALLKAAMTSLPVILGSRVTPR